MIRCGYEWTDDIAQRRCVLPKGHTSGQHEWHPERISSAANSENTQSGNRDLDAEQSMGATQSEAASQDYPIVDTTHFGVPIYGTKRTDD